MKKICIVTYFNSSNYGSRLQSTALSIVLRNIGYDVCFLKSFKAKKFILSHPRMIYARIRNKIRKKEKNKFFTPVPYHISKERKQRLDKYTEEFYKELNIDGDRIWNGLVEDRIIFASGSDIIWQPANGYPAKFFLDFACYAGLPCFAYGSSLGAQSLPKKYYNAYRKYLNSFVSVGVREERAAAILSDITGREITKVVDPTLLLSKEDWSELSQKAKVDKIITNTPYVLCYFVMNDERYWEYVKLVQEETGLQLVVLPMHSLDEKQPYSIIRDGTPYEFIHLIENSELVLTDSFHACVFSYLFEKEFYLMRRTRKAENDKYNDFLSRYHLEDRVVDDENVFIRKSDISSYKLGAKQLEKDRQQSLLFLKETLDKCK